MKDTLTVHQIPAEGFFGKLLYLNSVEEYIFWVAFIFVGVLVARIFRSFIKSKISKSKAVIASYYLKLERHLYPIIHAFLFYVAFHGLDKTSKIATIGSTAFVVTFTFLITRLVASLASVVIYSYLAHQDTSEGKVRQIRGIVLIVSGVLWTLGLILLFDNLGFDVTAVLTGLGVGGIAIALAAQTILGDIFNYFVIFFDRPFEVGDFIIVDDKMGVVEYVGLKTTRLKSLSGEQLIFSNTNLTSSRVHNFKRMKERRIVFRFGVLYDTGYEKLSEIPSIVKSIVAATNDVRLDRVHFASYGAYSIDFEVVYYILNSDYNFYMDTQQQLNLELYRRFEKRGIEFAFPTYSVKVDGAMMNGHNQKSVVFSEQ